jgi:hypothetical protein
MLCIAVASTHERDSRHFAWKSSLTPRCINPLVKIHLGIFTRGARRKIMKLIDVETVYGTFAPNVRYTGNEIMALLMQQPEAYNIENVITAIKNRSEDYNAGVRLHGKPQTMLTDDAVYIVENGYTL